MKFPMKWNWDFLFPKPEPRNLTREVEEGRRAAEFMNNASYQAALRRVREGIHLKWAESGVMDTEVQHELRVMLKLLDDLEGNIRAAITDGQLAAEELRHQQQQAEAKRERERRTVSRVA